MQTQQIVGEIRYARRIIPVYRSLEDPLFLAQDIMELIGYSRANPHKFMKLIEQDEKFKLPLVISHRVYYTWFLTENGLYNALSQSRVELARAWRRIIFSKLTEMRRQKGLNIIEQFEEWDHELDDIYFDDQGRIWQSKTVAGGDVEQVCLSEEVNA